MTCTEAVAAAVWGAHGEQSRPCRCETPGQRGKQESGSVRGYVRIYASEQCPRQDSNLRSRLRRPVLSPLSYGGSGLRKVTSPAGPAAQPADGRRPPGHLSAPTRSSRTEHPHFRRGRSRHCRGDATLAPVAQGLGRVLVVDDDEVIRQLIAVNLTLEGFDVATAVD